VRAYLCDGQTVSDWFVGSVGGNDLSLSSDNGAQLEGQLTSDTATGTITDPNGDPAPFEASLATGIAGLYNVDTSSNGALSGTSQAGGQLEDQLGNILEENDTYPVSGTITPPDGQSEDFRALTSPDTTDQHRWIVLADGQIKGGNVGGGFEFDHDDFDRNDFVFDDFDHGVGGTFGQVGGDRNGGGNCGLGPLLQEAGLVADEHRPLVCKVLDHVLAQVVAYQICVPLRLVEQSLHTIWGALSNGLGHLPAVLTLHRSGECLQVS
jgi:hypothetical protein